MRPLKPVLEPLFQVLRSQPHPLPPPAPSIPPRAKSTARTVNSAPLLPIAPHRSPQVAARRGVSVGGQSPRLARTPGAQHGRVLPCGHRSHGRTGSQHFRSPRHNLRAATTEGGHPQDETRTSQPPGEEGGGRLGRARAGRTTGTGEKALPDRRSHDQAPSGASQRHHSPPPPRFSRFRPPRS